MNNPGEAGGYNLTIRQAARYTVALLRMLFPKFTVGFIPVILLLIHGIAHLVGFVIPRKLYGPQGMAYKTTILGGKIDIGKTGIQVVGVFWLAFFSQ